MTIGKRTTGRPFSRPVKLDSGYGARLRLPTGLREPHDGDLH